MTKDEKRQARILALQVFFCYEQQEFMVSIEDVFERVTLFCDVEETENKNDPQDENVEIKEILKIKTDSPSELSKNVKGYALEIVKFAAQNLKEIDEMLCKYIRDWSFERLNSIDRNLLRIAASELNEKFAVPSAVVINEAIEIAKFFGTDDSAKFINAILDKIKVSISIENK
jgi:N utilization substance protein B